MKLIGLLTVAGSVALCGGIGTILLGVYLQREATASRDWPSTDGKVLSAEIETYHVKSGNSTTMKYQPRIFYMYWVGEKVYTCDQVSVLDTGGFDRERAESTVARYPVGTSVAVYYDAARPDTAVLEPGPPDTIPALFIAGAILVAGGLFILAVDSVERRKKGGR